MIMPEYVAHIVPEYLGHTLNWIYTQLRYLVRFTPYVMTRRIINRESYPLDMVFASRSPNTPLLPASLSDRIFRRLGYLPWRDYRCYSAVLRRFRPLLINAHFGWDGFFSLDLRRRHRIPLITRFYGYDVGMLPQLRIWQKRYRRLFREGDLFIVEGSHMKAALVDLGCPAEKVVVHHLGIELEKIEYRTRRSTPGQLHILIAGTFKEKKGIEYAASGNLSGKERIARRESCSNGHWRWRTP